MKKIIVSAVAVIAFAITAQAQEVKFGLKGGANFCFFGGEDAVGIKFNTGVHLGGVAEIKFTEMFSLQPEVLYSMQGSKVRFTSSLGANNFNSESNVKLNYLTIPLMGKFYPVKGFSLEAGPQMGILLSAREKVEASGVNNGTPFDLNNEFDVKQAYKTLDFGLSFGLAYDLPMGLFFQARYYAGLSQIGESYEEDGISYRAADLKNNVVQVSVGYKF